MPHFRQIKSRHQELLARCAEERRTMSVHNRELEAAASRVDRAIAFLGRVRQHPGVIVAVVAAVVIIKPRRLAGLVSGSLVALRAARVASNFAPLLQNLQNLRRPVI